MDADTSAERARAALARLSSEQATYTARDALTGQPQRRTRQQHGPGDQSAGEIIGPCYPRHTGLQERIHSVPHR